MEKSSTSPPLEIRRSLSGRSSRAIAWSSTLRLAAAAGLVAALAAAVAAAPERADDASAPEYAEVPGLGSGDLTGIAVYPPKIDLVGGDAAVQVVVTGIYSNGAVRDLTTEAAYSSSDPAIASAGEGGLLLPAGNGTAEIAIEAGGRRTVVPAAVSRMGEDLPISFPNDIVPVFSKHGCNSGGCHGKSGGQNGFQLSLFGYVPSLDYRSLTREARGRRVFPGAPEHSLLLRKATGALPHGGGERFAAGSPEYRLIHRWMRSGMPFGKPDDPTVAAIAVYPLHRVLPLGGRQQLAVTAIFSDGRREDVTRWAEFSSNDPDYLQVNAAGLAQASDLAGAGAVLVRFKGQVAYFRATIPTGADISGFQRPPEVNFIDRLVFARLQVLGVPPSQLAPDAEFLRRAFITICGTLPSVDETREFLSDPDPGKRARMVDRLLERPEYASHFALFWSDILRNQRGGDNRAAPLTIGFHRWIYESILANKPYDSFAREILCAEGSVEDNPPVVWYRALDNPKQLVDDTAQVFLGTRMQCARCHHHPFEKWAQEDYWNFANIFSRVSRKGNENSREFTITVRRNQSRITDDEPKSANFRKSYTAITPPGGAELPDSPNTDPRQRLADWMGSPENPLFARALVNRYWKHFLGRGIVEPEDDMRDTNPPSNPELLDALASDFVKGGYDLKRLVRTICASSTFQLSSEPNELNRRESQNFSRYPLRRLSAEALLDAVDRVTGVKTRFGGVLREMRAIDLPDESSRNYFLEIFGKPERSSACSCERSSDATLSQVLHLLNSKEIQDKIASDAGRAAALAKDPRPEAERIDELFLWTFSRPPSTDERNEALRYLASKANETTDPEKSRRRAWEDLLWALINSKEFAFIR